MSVPFFSTLGMELTWLWPQKSQENSWISGYSMVLSAAFRERRFPFYGCHNDGGALEISTPAFSNLEDLKSYYLKLKGHIHRVSLAHCVLTGKTDELVFSREDAVSGGGHIHVAIPERILRDPIWLLGFLTNLFRDLGNRPYLNWIFNDWGNTQSAENFFSLREKLTYQSYYDGFNEIPRGSQSWKQSHFLRLIYEANPKVQASWLKKDILNCFDISKGYAAKVSSPILSGSMKKPATIEFRCFDTKRDLSDIELHSDLVNAYLRCIEKKTRSARLIPSRINSRQDVEKLAKGDRCLMEFKSFMEEIGLDYGKYERFIETNYRKRAQAGLLR